MTLETQRWINIVYSTKPINKIKLSFSKSFFWHLNTPLKSHYKRREKTHNLTTRNLFNRVFFHDSSVLMTFQGDIFICHLCELSGHRTYRTITNEESQKTWRILYLVGLASWGLKNDRTSFWQRVRILSDLVSTT